MAETNIVNALQTLLAELVDGSGSSQAWMLNPNDGGLLNSLNKLSAEEASAIPSTGGASIAAHVDHLRYGLGLMNRWSQGEQPFADADYSASWLRNTVSEAEWTSLREALRSEAYAWREAIKRPRDVSDFELTGMIASVAHFAYHVGAIRQINRTTRGPGASD
ncbi:MAG TPA: DinB family protein [Bryobacteraceae bacterium]|nr:DinB family protein [Bryobacteraceae bacterium]